MPIYLKQIQRRQRLEARRRKRTTISDLPPEILELIGGQLSSSDVSALRRTSKRMHRVVRTKTQRDISRRFIPRSTSSADYERYKDYTVSYYWPPRKTYGAMKFHIAKRPKGQQRIKIFYDQPEGDVEDWETFPVTEYEAEEAIRDYVANVGRRVKRVKRHAKHTVIELE